MRQQQVVRSILVRLKGDNISLLAHIIPLIGVVNKDVQTDLTHREEVSIAYAFRAISVRDVATAQVPYTANIDLPGYGDSIVPDETAKRQLVAQMMAP